MRHLCLGKPSVWLIEVEWRIYIGKLTIIGSDNGLSPGRHQAFIRTNAENLLIRTLGTKSSEVLSKTHTFLIKKMHLKMSSEKWRPFCLGLNVLSDLGVNKMIVVLQTLISNAFYWIKSFTGSFKLHWSLFLGVQLVMSQHCFRLWRGAEQAASHYLAEQQCAMFLYFSHETSVAPSIEYVGL